MIAKLLGGWKLYAAIGLGGMLLVLGIYQAGVNAERKRGEAAHLRVVIETMQLDKAIADKALLSAADKSAELEAEAKINEDALNALRKSLAERPASDRCPAAPADLDRLY